VSTSPQIPKVESTEIVYEGFYKLKVDVLSLPHLEEKMSYTTLIAPERASVILAETEDGKLVINREYRHPAGIWIYALPGGRVDPGEEPLATAQRELLEESGYTAESWEHLGTAYSLPALCNQKIFYYLARNARYSGPPRKEPFELITTELLHPQELIKTIRSGAPTDGILLTALSFYLF